MVQRWKSARVFVERQVFARQHTLCKVIIALEFDAVADHQFAVVEKVFQRHLGRLPVPPATGSAAFAFDIFGRERSTLPNEIADMVDDFLHVVTKLVEMPARFLELFLFDVGMKVRVVRQRELADRMRPGLEEEAAIKKGIEIGGVVEPGASQHDQVVAAGDHTDGIELQQADALDDAFKLGLGCGGGALVQALLVDGEALDGIAGDGDGRDHERDSSTGFFD